MLSAQSITDLHDRLTALWHTEPNAAPPQPDPFLSLVAGQHRANFDLWHIEDEARRPGAADADVRAVPVGRAGSFVEL